MCAPKPVVLVSTARKRSNYLVRATLMILVCSARKQSSYLVRANLYPTGKAVDSNKRGEKCCKVCMMLMRFTSRKLYNK